MIMTRAMLLALLLATCSAVPAASLVEGIDAHEAGDYATAYAVLVPLAEAGSVEAMFRVATLHSLGQGRPVDHAAAAAWFERAAERDHREAAVTLANMHLSGLGVPRDEARAMHWFERAAAIAERYALDVEDCD